MMRRRPSSTIVGVKISDGRAPARSPAANRRKGSARRAARSSQAVSSARPRSGPGRIRARVTAVSESAVSSARICAMSGTGCWSSIAET
jgi:hypothetical protein